MKFAFNKPLSIVQKTKRRKTIVIKLVIFQIFKQTKYVKDEQWTLVSLWNKFNTFKSKK